MFCGLRKNAKGRPMGTPNACMKRGMGIGMMIQQQKAANLGMIPQQENNPIGINQQMPEFNIVDDNDMRDRFDLLGNFDISNPVGYNLQPVPVAPDLRNQMRDAELARVTNELANEDNLLKANNILENVLKKLKIQMTKINLLNILDNAIEELEILYGIEKNPQKKEKIDDISTEIEKLYTSLNINTKGDNEIIIGIKPEQTKGVKNLRSKISNLKKKKEAKSLKKELEKIETAMELKKMLEDSEEALDNPLQVQRGITNNFREENEQLKKAFRIAKKNNQPYNLRFDIDNMLEQIAVFKKRFPTEKKLLVVLQKMKSVIKQEEAKRDKYQPK
ncbi:MAG: hypothetical protein ACJATM_001307 [Alphaproteobacteria bacterium]|jgi:hypothetical protein